MKTRTAALATLLVASLSAPQAFAEAPLVEKSSGSGFVPPQWRRSERCRLFANRVEIERSFGDAVVSEVRTLQTKNLPALLKAAALENVEETPNLMCDGPSTYVSFAGMAGADRGVLYSTGGCGSPTQRRVGPASLGLVGIIDAYCPTTHEAPGR